MSNLVNAAEIAREMPGFDFKPSFEQAVFKYLGFFKEQTGWAPLTSELQDAIEVIRGGKRPSSSSINLALDLLEESGKIQTDKQKSGRRISGRIKVLEIDNGA